MEYLFKAPVVMVGSTTWYDVFLKEDGSYFCNQTCCHNASDWDKGPGDATLQKEDKKWKAVNVSHFDADIIERLGEHIDDYNRDKK